MLNDLCEEAKLKSQALQEQVDRFGHPTREELQGQINALQNELEDERGRRDAAEAEVERLRAAPTLSTTINQALTDWFGPASQVRNAVDALITANDVRDNQGRATGSDAGTQQPGGDDDEDDDDDSDGGRGPGERPMESRRNVGYGAMTSRPATGGPGSAANNSLGQFNQRNSGPGGLPYRGKGSMSAPGGLGRGRGTSAPQLTLNTFRANRRPRSALATEEVSSPSKSRRLDEFGNSMPSPGLQTPQQVNDSTATSRSTVPAPPSDLSAANAPLRVNISTLARRENSVLCVDVNGNNKIAPRNVYTGQGFQKLVERYLKNVNKEGRYGACFTRVAVDNQGRNVGWSTGNGFPTVRCDWCTGKASKQCVVLSSERYAYVIAPTPAEVAQQAQFDSHNTAVESAAQAATQAVMPATAFDTVFGSSSIAGGGAMGGGGGASGNVEGGGGDGGGFAPGGGGSVPPGGGLTRGADDEESDEEDLYS
ncbi:unnamed protein product [Zymoseptoria tritici ST99CH_3D7]|uniref:Uncharacterized protein n=1 Tax=Zymoseptoria tritici (strain ST99CH_3D7) TaxID=1276538 RepID=A0A1X7S633_ZYMT9|nr:unnamed protein product [Zymoseptoria tritici ST99CH_3D7]